MPFSLGGYDLPRSSAFHHSLFGERVYRGQDGLRNPFLRPGANYFPDDQNKIALDRQHMELQRLDNVKIVVVDDQQEVRSSVGRFLSNKGARVQACQNVDQALEVVPKLEPDLIISDIRMPEKDGFELLNAVRLMERDSIREVPVIAMTAFEPEIKEIIASPPMFDGFLTKPFTPIALMRVISDVLTQ